MSADRLKLSKSEVTSMSIRIIDLGYELNACDPDDMVKMHALETELNDLVWALNDYIEVPDVPQRGDIIKREDNVIHVCFGPK